MRAARDADAIRRRVANFGNAAGTSTGARRMGSERSMDDRKNIDALVDAFRMFVHVNKWGAANTSPLMGLNVILTSLNHFARSFKFCRRTIPGTAISQRSRSFYIAK